MNGEPFNFWNGRVAYDVEGLLKCISEISNEEFFTYVNGKNDFANWIQGSLQYSDLAQRIKPLSERDLIVAILSDFLDKGKSRMIIGVPKDFHEDALVKEIMEKNANFLGVKEEKKEKIIDPIEQQNAEGKKNEENLEKVEKIDKLKVKEKEKGSTISIMDFPKRKHSLDKEFFIGMIFGIIIGALLTLILYKLFMLG